MCFKQGALDYSCAPPEAHGEGESIDLAGQFQFPGKKENSPQF